jgi:hypothetical protein
LRQTDRRYKIKKPRGRRGGLLNKTIILQRYSDRNEIFGSDFSEEGPTSSRGNRKTQAHRKKAKSKSSKFAKGDPPAVFGLAIAR